MDLKYEFPLFVVRRKTSIRGKDFPATNNLTLIGRSRAVLRTCHIQHANAQSPVQAVPRSGRPDRRHGDARYKRPQSGLSARSTDRRHRHRVNSGQGAASGLSDPLTQAGDMLRSVSNC